MDMINWGIIGCGNVTEFKSGPAFSKVTHSSLIAVMRRNKEKAQDYAHRHGVPKWYDDAELLIHDPDVNAIYIATPPSSHEEYTLRALKAGIPVYVEKPVAMDAASALRMYHASLEYGTPLVVAHYRRGLPLFNSIKEMLAKKVIGEVRFVNMQLLQPLNPGMVAQTEENWRLNPAISGGGLFHDLAPHQLDLMIWFFGQVRSSHGFSLNQSQTSPSDDFVSGEMVFESGIPFKGLWSFNVPEELSTETCEIVGTEGKLTFSIFSNFYELQIKGKKNRVEFELPPHIQQPMIDQVVQYFRGKRPNPCDGTQGVEVMKIIDSFTKNNQP